MKTVDRVTVLGPKPSTRTSYDAALIGPPGPRGLKGDTGETGPQGPPGTGGGSGGAGVVTAVQLTYVNGATRNAHRILIAEDGGSYTYGITQEEDVDAGDPEVLTLRCPDDETCHDVSIVKVGSTYDVYVDPTVSSTTTLQAAVHFLCTSDITFHYLMVRRIGSVYVLQPTQ